jgi:hypothetical protein
MGPNFVSFDTPQPHANMHIPKGFLGCDSKQRLPVPSSAKALVVLFLVVISHTHRRIAGQDSTFHPSKPVGKARRNDSDHDQARREGFPIDAGRIVLCCCCRHCDGSGAAAKFCRRPQTLHNPKRSAEGATVAQQSTDARNAIMNRGGDNSNETVEQANAPLFLRRHESEPEGAAASGAGDAASATKPAPAVSSAGDAQQQPHDTDAESRGDEALKSPPNEQPPLTGKRKAEVGKGAGEPGAATKGARKSWKKPKVRSTAGVDCLGLIFSRCVQAMYAVCFA